MTKVKRTRKSEMEKLVEKYPELSPYTFWERDLETDKSVFKITDSGRQILHDIKMEEKNEI